MTAFKRAKHHFDLYYRKNIEELITTNTPGYWKDINLCGGLKGGCREPLHRFMFCEGGTHHTYSFIEYGRDLKGRFKSPYLAWDELRKMDL